MRAVTGSVVSSKPISLSKASTVLARFAVNENAARPEVAAFVRRASAAFDELVCFHREIRVARKRPELEKLLMEEEDERKKEKKKRRKRSRDKPESGDEGMLRSGGDGEIGAELGSDGKRKKKKRRKKADAEERSELAIKEEKNVVSVTNLVEGVTIHGGVAAELGSDGEGKKKKRRKKVDEEEISELAIKEEKNVVSDGNLVGKGRHCEDGAEREEDGKRRKKMVYEEETSSLGRKGEKKSEAEEEKHKHRKKKEKREKHKGDTKEEVFAEVLDWKHRKHSDIGEELEELKDQKEQRKKKKKKNKRMED